MLSCQNTNRCPFCRFAPTRTLYLAFGHDEEVGGERGAGATAALLEKEGVQLDMILDEGGGLLLNGMEPLTPHPVARIGLAEKVSCPCIPDEGQCSS